MFNFISRNLRISLITPSHAIIIPFLLSSMSSFSSSKRPNSPPNSSNKKSFTVNYLINSCGFTPESALSASKSLNLKTRKKPDSVLAIFKKYGFNDAQIVNVLKRYPKFLLCDPRNTLLPKLQFLSAVGFTGPDITKLVTAQPVILGYSLENRIVPSYIIVRDLLQSDETAIRAIKRSSYLLALNLQKYATQNIEVLREVGVPESNIVAYFTLHTSTVMMANNHFRRFVEEVKEMGFHPSKQKFMVAFHALKSSSKSNWEKKVEVYKKWGWSEDDILVAFGKDPWCMCSSEDKIERIMDFLVNKMGLQSSVLVNRPKLFTSSLEKRIVPRSLLYQVLLDRGLIDNEEEKGVHLTTWLVISEKRFINMIRRNFKDDAPQLLKLYQEKLDLAKSHVNLQSPCMVYFFVIDVLIDQTLLSHDLCIEDSFKFHAVS